MRRPLIACCDIGGTKMLAGLVTPEGDILATARYPFGDRSTPEQIIDDLDATFDGLLAETAYQRSDLIALGVSTTGVMDIYSGVVHQNHNLDWRFDVPFAPMLTERLGIPAFLEMDANAAALGEGWRGQAVGMQSYVYIIVGTGIGAGLVINGDLVRGAHSSGGEIGHMVIVPGGALCGCGKHGCLEALSAGVALARKGEAAVTLGRATTLRDLDPPITGEMVAAAARNGDSVAQAIIDEAGYYLGIGIANVTTLLDPEAIILGGGVALNAFDLLEDGLQRGLQAHLNYWAKRDLPVVPSTLGEQVGLLGAARSALNRLDSKYQVDQPA